MADDEQKEECLVHTPSCIRVNGRWERPETAHCPKSESGYHVYARLGESTMCTECGTSNVDQAIRHG